MNVSVKPNLFFVSYYMMWNVCPQSKHVKEVLFRAHMLLRKRCEYTYTKSGYSSVLEFWRYIRNPTQELFNAFREQETPYAKSNSGLLIWLAPDNEVLGCCEIVDFSINRFCVKEDGKGLGSAFYKNLMTYWLDVFGTPLYIRADKRVVGFFKRMGCYPLEEDFGDEWVIRWKATRTDGHKKKDVGMYDPVVIPLLQKCEWKDNKVGLTDEMMKDYNEQMEFSPNALWNLLDPLPEPEPKKPAGLPEMLEALVGMLSDKYGGREVKIESVTHHQSSTAV